MHDDQPRLPDLDAAIDAVVPSLTAVDDETVVTSLRRTRVALSEPRPARSLAGWRWAVPAAALVAAAIAALVWWPASPIEGPRVVISDGPPPAAPGPLPVKAPPLSTAAPTSPRVRATRLDRAVRVAATSTIDAPPRPDPLDALVRAVQGIPEEAWRAGVARAGDPGPVPEIEIAPIDTPPLGDVPAEPIAPGEP